MSEPVPQVIMCADGRFAVLGDNEFRTDDRELAGYVADEIARDENRGLLDFQPGANWVQNKGGLPQYIDRIAKHLFDNGMTVSHAIATAVNVVKKACATGDLNYPGIQHENAGSQSEACAAVAEWEALKAKAHTDNKGK